MNIGNLQLKNNIFMAPMAGITDLAFRTIVREFGASLCFTEMISAAGLTMGTVKSCRYLQSTPSDRPLGIQIFGSDPYILADGAKIAEDAKADLIDINMGCPARKVLKNGAGGSLMRNPSRVAEIVKKVRKAVNIPLTIKIRSGWREDEITAVEIAHIAEDCGANALILHPRTVHQGFSGQADWNLIGTVKSRLHIPVIGSGDIKVADDGPKMIARTGCDAVMAGRGALGNPWIFKTMVNMFKNGRGTKAPSFRERQKIIERHLEMTIGIYGESLGIKNFRKHLAWYTKGLKGSSQFRQAAFHITDKDSLIGSVHRYLQSLNNSDVKILDNKDK